MGPGTGGVKVGVSPAGPGPQTVPAAPQPRLSQRAGFLGKHRWRDPVRLLSSAFVPQAVQMLRPSSAKLFPQPRSAWVGRPGLHKESLIFIVTTSNFCLEISERSWPQGLSSPAPIVDLACCQPLWENAQSMLFHFS